MRQIILSLIRIYQWSISPFLGHNCRFEPSCSQYGFDAIQRFGVVRGGKFTLLRLLKCHPFHRGGWDPVPKVK